jgi:hypothetical protein
MQLTQRRNNICDEATGGEVKRVDLNSVGIELSRIDLR